MVKLTARADRALLWLAACTLLACKDAPPPAYAGMDALSGQRIRVRMSALPDGARWQGCYASPQLGQLLLAEHAGGKLTGHYLYTRGACEVLGELRGKHEGNVASFELVESTAGCTGWDALRGQGYLLFSRALVPGQPAQLLGERSYLRVRQVSRDRGILEPYDLRRVSALRTEASDRCAELTELEQAR